MLVGRHQRRRSIRASVVDHQDFVGDSQRLQRPCDVVERLENVVALAVRGDDDGERARAWSKTAEVAWHQFGRDCTRKGVKSYHLFFKKSSGPSLVQGSAGVSGSNAPGKQMVTETVVKRQRRLDDSDATAESYAGRMDCSILKARERVRAAF